MKSTGYLLLCFLLFPAMCIAQETSLTKIQNDLLKDLKKLESINSYISTSDSQPFFNDKIIRKFKFYLHKYPATLTYNFKFICTTGRADFENCCGLKIITASDSQLRIYTWDDEEGGTQRSYNNVFQFKSGDSVYVKAYPSSNNVIKGRERGRSLIAYALNVPDHKYYLVLSIWGSSHWAESEACIYEINGKTLVEPEIIKTAKDLTSHVSIDYDSWDLHDTLNPQRELPMIKYDPGKKMLSIRVVLENGTGTNRYINYQFNGQYFEKVVTNKE